MEQWSGWKGVQKLPVMAKTTECSSGLVHYTEGRERERDVCSNALSEEEEKEHRLSDWLIGHQEGLPHQYAPSVLFLFFFYPDNILCSQGTQTQGILLFEKLT